MPTFQILFDFQSNSGHAISTYFCSCHDSNAVVASKILLRLFAQLVSHNMFCRIYFVVSEMGSVMVTWKRHSWGAGGEVQGKYWKINCHIYWNSYLVSTAQRLSKNPCRDTKFRADSELLPSQWEMSLQSNVISHWLGANLESALKFTRWNTAKGSSSQYLLCNTRQ